VYRDRVDSPPLHPDTLAVLGGRRRGPGEPLNQPPVFASAFTSGAGPDYARRTNPTWEAFEEALGALEGGTAVAFGSGMAAASAAIDCLPPGARIVVAASAYVEVRALLADRAARGSLRVSTVDPTETEAAIEALAEADALWLDAITNPGLEVPALDRILDAARGSGTRTIVDATLATPAVIRPLELGADIVVHSATKYIGGHSDLVLGAAVAREAGLAEGLRDVRTATGAVPGTMEAWLALRGLRTLPLRIARGARTAAILSARLASHPRVANVRYPSLGAVLCFELASAERADAFCETLAVITHASSLGGVETLIERQARWHAEPHVSAALLRLSVGCEDAEDLWRDLERGLALCA
jgi:cystathionine gamma-synthase